MAITWGEYGVGVAVIAAVLLVGVLASRWLRLFGWWQCRAQRGNGAQQHKIARAISQVVADPNWRTLHTKLLGCITELCNAESASLLVWSELSNRFVLRELRGTKPGSFQIGDLTPFINWLRKARRTVTRRDLVEDPALAEIKTCGLQYCVQFHVEACVPCFLGENLLAIINLGPRCDRDEYDKSLCNALDEHTSHCALGLRNAMLSEQLSDRSTQVKELRDLRVKFLANVSHELRTPLSGIIGLADHLLEDGVAVDPDEARKYLTMIHDSGERLLHTLTALVDLAKLEANKIDLHVRRLNLSRVANEAIAALKPSPTTSFEVTFNGNVPPVYGDEAWLRQLMDQLLDNAVKFTLEGRIWVDAKRAGDMLEVTVNDTGIGIPKDRQGEVFSGFVQSSNGAARTHEGTGVGLAISRRVVELHGGRIWLDSQPGVGSHVHFTLPLKPSAIA